MRTDKQNNDKQNSSDNLFEKEHPRLLAAYLFWNLLFAGLSAWFSIDKGWKAVLKVVLASLLLSQPMIYTSEVLSEHAPVAMVYNSGPKYSLINSIEHHPKQNLFCVTYTHNNKVVLYKINDAGQPEVFQSLGNPLAKLSQPQHAVFSPDGEKIVVANWLNQTLTVYQRNRDGYFRKNPAAVIFPPSSLMYHKPHGIAFSPCGNYLAIAYGAGAAPYNRRAIALYSVTDKGLGFELVQLLEGDNDLPGIPKGITFSPDGTCLLVTFSDINTLTIFNLSGNNKGIIISPRQIIQGEDSALSRPEDVKISANGKYCAISNSDRDTVTFYPFDKTINRITQGTPIDILQNPEACFHFPHGITFSPDGLYMLVTQFGQVDTTEEGEIVWDHATRPEESKFNLYQLTRNSQSH
jgi:DNA-binding beta-propeller fold protein YncE